MRAVALTEYGDADVMSVQELPDPLVGPDVVLVRVAAVGVNPVDYKIRQPQVVNNTTWHAPAAWETARRPRIRAGAPARPASGCGSRPRSPPPDAGRRPPPR